MLPLNMPFWTEKVPSLYTFHYKMMALSHAYLLGGHSNQYMGEDIVQSQG